MGRFAVIVAGLALMVAACGDGAERRVSADAIAQAQPRVATVFGVVTRGGEPVPGGRVSLVGADAAERSATTGPDGAYVVPGVPPGRYSLVVSGESGVSCAADGCISAAWSERSDVVVPGEGLLRHDVDGD
ncbi:MAG: carboxypeptidase-like regulatory domain-containing protein [Actinomycetota bacterium]|nr:carboxypeptidase-like regulatory domain-containing protein [Actinomycetota bacterium]